MLGFCEQGNESLLPVINRATITSSIATCFVEAIGRLVD